ncbi:MAG: MFS transporter [Candidatus Caldarchaeum sp.]|nr:MFS transporter [Candidatus Caldarchaeum sp.]
MDVKRGQAFKRWSELDREIKVLLTGTLLTGASIYSMMQMSPVQAVLLQASYTDTGLLTGFARNAVYVVLSPMTALLLTRLNWNTPLPVSAALMALSHFMMWLANDLLMVLASQLVMGVAMFFFFPCGESIVANSYRGTQRLKTLSVFLSAISGGFLTGSILAGAIAYLAGLKSLFASMIFLSLAAFLAYTRLKLVNSMPVESKPLKIKSLAVPILLSTPYFFTLSAAYSVLPGFFVLNGFTELDVGVLFFIHMLCRVSTYSVISRIKTVFVKPLLAASSIFLGLTFLLASIQTANFTIFLLILGLLGVAVSTSYITTLQIISTHGGGHSVFLIGMLETLIGLTFITGPPISGFLIDVYGAQAMMLMFTAVVFLAVALHLLQRYQL